MNFVNVFFIDIKSGEGEIRRSSAGKECIVRYCVRNFYLSLVDTECIRFNSWYIICKIIGMTIVGIEDMPGVNLIEWWYAGWYAGWLAQRWDYFAHMAGILTVKSSSYFLETKILALCIHCKIAYSIIVLAVNIYSDRLICSKVKNINDLITYNQVNKEYVLASCSKVKNYVNKTAVRKDK